MVLSLLRVLRVHTRETVLGSTLRSESRLSLGLMHQTQFRLQPDSPRGFYRPLEHIFMVLG